MHVYHLSRVVITPKSQILLPKGIQLVITKGHVATVSSTDNPSPCKPFVCPGIIDPAFSDKLVLLIVNLTDKPLLIDPKHPIAYIHLLPIDVITKIAPCGSLIHLSLL